MGSGAEVAVSGPDGSEDSKDANATQVAVPYGFPASPLAKDAAFTTVQCRWITSRKHLAWR